MVNQEPVTILVFAFIQELMMLYFYRLLSTITDLLNNIADWPEQGMLYSSVDQTVVADLIA